MKGYKAFEKGLICKGKQYAENTVFEESEAKICKRGIHFCANPFDVLDYYPLVDDNGNMPDFAEVEAIDEPVTDDNKKYCTKKLHVGAKLGLKGFIKACIEFTLDITKSSNVTASDKDMAKLASSGDMAKLASSGNGAQLASSGDMAKLASSGVMAQLASSGDMAKLASSGDMAQLASSGENTVVMCAGMNSRAKAMKGSWITLSEWKYKDGKRIPVCVKTEQVDGEIIKEDTFYELKNGKFTEISK